MKTHKRVTAILSAACACILAGVFFFVSTLRFVDFSAAGFTESSGELKNPYVGWYKIHPYDLSSPGSADQTEDVDPGPGLALLEFNLQAYADGPVSQSGLDYLDQILKSWHSVGRQLIVRFLYDWEGTAMETEPRDLNIILNHMTQTAKIINKYSDSVYIMQGLFIGAWGEMHSSRYADTEDMLALASHLDSVIDPGIFLAVRTPEQWRLLARSEEPLTEASAQEDALSSRTSLFNDSMMGSSTDFNTYAEEPEASPSSPYGKRNREEELAFQDLLCTYVPNGGEVVIDNPLNDFPSALSVLAGTHVSYLNQAYDEAVLSKWKDSLYTEEGIYKNMNGLDYISRHLGYRYVLRSSGCTDILPWEKDAVLSVTLENTGFSNSYRPFEVSFTLKNKISGKRYSVPVTADPRLFCPGVPVSLEVPLHIRDYPAGTYDVLFQIQDPASGYQIALANEASQTEDGYAAGELEIQAFPK